MKKWSRPVLRNRKFMMAAVILTLSGIALAVVGILGVYFTTYPGVTIKRVGFETAPYDSPPRKVSGLLFLPEEPVETPTPAVVFCHGMTVQKEIYVSQCRELARHGLIVLDIDLRGHGSSGGKNDFGNTEMRDVWAAVDYLSGLEEVDSERIGVAGHSLGGITSTRAGIFQPDQEISAVAAIYCWPGQREAIELVFGPLEDFIGNLWPYFGMSRRYDVNDEAAQKERDIADSVTRTKPPNYLLIIGDTDQLGSVEQARQIMKKATGFEEIEDNKTYGDFERGTARRLEVTDDDHITEAASTEVLRALTKWFFRSYGLKEPQGVKNNAIMRYLGWAAIAVGFLAVALASVYLVRAYRREDKGDYDIAPYRPDGRGSGVWLGALSVVLFVGISLVAFPFAGATGIRGFIPFFGIDVFSSMVLARTILLVPASLVLYLVIRMKQWDPLPFPRPEAPALGRLGVSVTIGVAPALVFTVLYAPTAYGLLLPRGVPVSLGWFLALAAVLTLQLWAEQEYFHYFFMPAFYPCTTGTKRVTYILSEALVRGVSFGLAFIPVLSSPFHLIGRPGMMGRVPAVPALMIGGFLIFLPISALTLYARRRGYLVLAPCLTIALFVALTASCFLSVRAF